MYFVMYIFEEFLCAWHCSEHFTLTLYNAIESQISNVSIIILRIGKVKHRKVEII